MDEVVHAAQEVRKNWDQTVDQLKEHVRAIEKCGGSGKGTEEANTLPRLNGAARDGLAQLRSLQFKLDLLAQQLPTEEEVQIALSTLEYWKKQYERFNHSPSSRSTAFSLVVGC